jgi:hypothetical protein
MIALRYDYFLMAWFVLAAASVSDDTHRVKCSYSFSVAP